MYHSFLSRAKPVVSPTYLEKIDTPKSADSAKHIKGQTPFELSEKIT
jgi:hypothetical protein